MSGYTTAYIVPTGMVAVVHCITAYNNAGSLTNSNVSVGLGAAGPTFWVHTFLSGGGIGWADWEGRLVFNAGEGIEVHADTATDVYIGGYLLSG